MGHWPILRAHHHFGLGLSLQYGLVHLVFQGVADQTFQSNDVFMSLKIVYILANSADPDKMLPYAAFHLGLHCLPKYLFSHPHFDVQFTTFYVPTYYFLLYACCNDRNHFSVSRMKQVNQKLVF